MAQNIYEKEMEGVYMSNIGRQQYISFGTSAGICNRLKRFITALRFEIDQNRTIDFYWSQGDLTNKSFYELFEFGYYKVNEIYCTKKISDESKEEVGKNNSWRLLVEDGELPQGFTKAFKKDDEKKEYIDFEYERIPQKIKEEYLKYFNMLKPTKAVRERIESIKLPDNAISVHIRAGRFWNEYGRGNRDSVNDFIEVMKKYPKDIIFFLAAADENVSIRVNEEFPGRIIELENKSYTDSIDAVAELYLLGKTNTLIATYGSTFSEVAWWLGGCKQKVAVVGEINWKIKCPICGTENVSRIMDYPKTDIIKRYHHLYREVPDNLEIVDYSIYRCLDCQLVFANPMQGGSQNFYSWVTSHENYYPTIERPRWEWAVIRSYLQDNNINSLLEVGCGTGEFLDYAKMKSNARMVGLDTTITSCNICKSKGHEVFAEPLERYIVNHKEKFDIVVAFHLLEHVDNPLDLVNDMMQLVDRDGKCMLSFPYSAVDVETCFTTANNMPPHHITRWTYSAIEALAKAVDADFELVAPMAGSVKDEIYSDLRNEFFPIYENEPSRNQIRWKVIRQYKRAKQIISSEKNKENILLAENIGETPITRRPPWFVLLVLTKR